MPSKSPRWLGRSRGSIPRSITCPPPISTSLFHELPADSVYTGGVPARPVLVTGLFRAGHPEAETTRLVTEIAAVTRVTGIAADRVLVAMQTTPAQFAFVLGRFFPDPVEEHAANAKD